jgi:UDP-glucose 4-epimerase
LTKDKPLLETDEPHPHGPYAVSKWKAEQGLNQISQESGLEVVILRLPLVYGPRVRGNFLRLLNLVSRVSLLPFGGLDNRRSMIGVGNLCDFIVRCIQHENAARQTFFVSDGRDLTVTQLVRLLAYRLRRRCILFPVPKLVLEVLAGIAGKPGAVSKLVESFQVDIRKAREMLNWTPPNSIEAEIGRTVLWFEQRMRQREA